MWMVCPGKQVDLAQGIDHMGFSREGASLYTHIETPRTLYAGHRATGLNVSPAAFIFCFVLLLPCHSTIPPF
jgi:hypothetical protein